MKKTLIRLDIDRFPSAIRQYLQNATIYDSSCSDTAKVYFVDNDEGFYLKISDKNTLQREAQMTEYFNSIGLGPKVMEYVSSERDMMITQRVLGEDCTHPDYLANPIRLCDTLAQIQLMLHSKSTKDCPVKDKTREYLSYAKGRCQKGFFDNSLVNNKTDVENAVNAMTTLNKYSHLLKSDCIVHGDFCLPNIMLDNWKFSGFIDVGHAGVSDRHIDIFWTLWSLAFNLKTDRYTDRFIDAYGKDRVDKKALKAVLCAEMFG